MKQLAFCMNMSSSKLVHDEKIFFFSWNVNSNICNQIVHSNDKKVVAKCEWAITFLLWSF